MAAITVSELSAKRARRALKRRCNSSRTDRSRDCQTGGLPNSAAHVDGAGGCQIVLNDGRPLASTRRARALTHGEESSAMWSSGGLVPACVRWDITAGLGGTKTGQSGAVLSRP